MNPSEQPDWSRLRTQTGTAEAVPGAIEQLLHAPDAVKAEAAYWQLDNHVVVQGSLFEAAPWTAAAVVAGICRGDASEAALVYALDLLFELVAGHADESEAALGNADLRTACMQEVRSHLPYLRSLTDTADGRESETLLQLLDIVDTDESH